MDFYLAFYLEKDSGEGEVLCCFFFLYMRMRGKDCIPTLITHQDERTDAAG